MRLTVDSKDPLQDVLAVVGAMYGVPLQVAAADAGDAPAGTAAPEGAGEGTGDDAGEGTADERAAARPSRARRAPRRAAAAEARPSRASARARGGDAVDSRAVRAWARENGHDVSARGRLSASLVEAYRAANG